MYALLKNWVRVKNKNKGKRKRNNKVNSMNSVEESFDKYVGLNSNNSNESFLSESSDTLTHWLSYRIKQATPNITPNSLDQRSP